MAMKVKPSLPHFAAKAKDDGPQFLNVNRLAKMVWVRLYGMPRSLIDDVRGQFGEVGITRESRGPFNRFESFGGLFLERTRRRRFGFPEGTLAGVSLVLEFEPTTIGPTPYGSYGRDGPGRNL